MTYHDEPEVAVNAPRTEIPAIPPIPVGVDRSLAALARAVSGDPPPRPPYRREGLWLAAPVIATATAILILLLALAPSAPPVTTAAPAISSPEEEW